MCLTRRCSVKKVFLEILQNSRKFCEFWEISKNNFFTEHLRATASVLVNLHGIVHLLIKM